MSLESACIPVPSEAIMLFAGFDVTEGDMTLFGIVTAGVLRQLVGSWIAWAAGYFGRVELLEKNRLIHINPKHLDWADRWFQRHGDATVFFTRMLPIIRTFISLPAGVARMPFWRFTLLTLARLHPLGADARRHRPRGRRQLGGVARLPPLRRLRRRSPRSSAGIIWLRRPAPRRGTTGPTRAARAAGA